MPQYSSSVAQALRVDNLELLQDAAEDRLFAQRRKPISWQFHTPSSPDGDSVLLGYTAVYAGTTEEPGIVSFSPEDLNEMFPDEDGPLVER